MVMTITVLEYACLIVMTIAVLIYTGGVCQRILTISVL